MIKEKTILETIFDYEYTFSIKVIDEIVLLKPHYFDLRLIFIIKKDSI